jgi:hypothetical protein
MTSAANRERRYRRLLRLYPQAYRQEYEEEIIGVLLADGRSGPGELVDLIRSALVAQARNGRRVAGHELADPSWRQTAGAIQLFGAILLASIGMRRDLLNGLGTVVRGGPMPAFHYTGWDLAYVSTSVVWLCVVLCALAGYALRGRGSTLLRAAAAGFAALGVLQEIGPRARYYAESPVVLLDVYWLIVAAALVGLC